MLLESNGSFVGKKVRLRTFYFVADASGSGKTAIMPDLKKILGDAVSVYDFDDTGVQGRC
jgi:hypothetical protein